MRYALWSTSVISAVLVLFPRPALADFRIRRLIENDSCVCLYSRALSSAADDILTY